MEVGGLPKDAVVSAVEQVFQLDFQDTIYYQLQFMSGKKLDPFLVPRQSVWAA